MEKHNIFFGPDGLTSTSAQYIANLAKEMFRLEEHDLEDMQFVNELRKDTRSGMEVVTRRGWDEQECADILTKVEHMMRLKCLIAWLREAIKAKSALCEEVTRMTDIEVLAKMGMRPAVAPKGIVDYTEDDYYGTLSLGERNKIYALQTKAATIGKLVHDGGPMTIARTQLHDAKKTPCMVESTMGGNVVITSFQPLVKERMVNDMFFEMQRMHRELQAELNGYKHKAEVAVSLEMQRRRNNYTKALINYDVEQKQQRVAIDNWRDKEHRKVLNLKIVVPQDLMETYKEVAGTK